VFVGECVWRPRIFRVPASRLEMELFVIQAGYEGALFPPALLPQSPELSACLGLSCGRNMDVSSWKEGQPG